MKWDSSKPWIFIVVRNGFQVLNSKQIVTMADYTFNYSLLFINHRLINLSVDCPWDRSPQGWLPGPSPGSHRRTVLFLPSYQSPRTSLSGGSAGCSYWSPCKRRHVRLSVASLSPEPASPPRVSLPGAAQGPSFPVSDTRTVLPHLELSFVYKLLPIQ